MDQPKSRLIVDPETGKPLIGVGAGTVGTFLAAYYPEAQKLIRIATGYFRLDGYKLGRSYLKEGQKIQYYILVGPEEGGYNQLAIREEIEDELKSGNGVYAPIVSELVRRLENGGFIILDSREMQVDYHCKFYICDNSVLVHGSGNYTRYGLKSQHEQASATRDPKAISEFIDWFKEASATAKDMTLPLLEVLREWLKLALPFHAYLKFLAALDIFFDRPNVPDLMLPVYYQQWVIGRAIAHIREHKSAIILAATGLGKTIMGAELAFWLKAQQIGSDIILIAPSGVHQDWQDQLKPRGFHVTPISTDLLFKEKSKRKYHKVFKSDALLEKATDQTIILIDEAHAYRNQLKAHWQKHIKQRKDARGSVAVDRVHPVVNDQKATIILLTATPYGTNPKNAESMLEFMPTPPLTPDMSSWTRRKVPSLDEFTQLPFVSSLGLGQVLQMARERGDVDNGRVFVQFGKHKRYLPETVYLRRISYELPSFELLRAAFDIGLFAQEIPNYPDGYIDEKEAFGTQIVDSTNSQFIAAWLSSSRATADCITKNLFTLGVRDVRAQQSSPALFPGYQQTTTENMAAFPTEEQQKKLGYKSVLKEDWSRRELRLRSVRDKLRALTYDDKATKLLALLKTHLVEKDDKVLVFVERHSTASFLEAYLTQAKIAKFHVGCTVTHQTKSDGYTLKTQDRRNELLDNFSPNSRGTEPTYPVNILICTDANGIGVNLQDANVVVNYDTADSADILFQRAGRIIRFTNEPHRKIYLYTFKPDVSYKESSKACQKIVTVFENMTKHHGRSRKTFGLSILPESDEEIIDLNDPKKEADFVSQFSSAQDSSTSDPLFRHTAILDKNRTLATSIRDGIYSSMVYRDKATRVAMLIQEGTKVHAVLYNLATNSFEHTTNHLPIIDLIACEPFTQNAPITLEEVEKAAISALNEWRSHYKVTGEVSLNCCLYLMPKTHRSFIKELFRPYIHFRKRHQQTRADGISPKENER
ncbi:helicase-related protein [uncultured Fibrella sp.]|uniref:helicase-related protein n=1 Tax=uncultured Fibrella sp. TaxID=1284596 RepID=UPI0035CBCE7F